MRALSTVGAALLVGVAVAAVAEVPADAVGDALKVTMSEPSEGAIVHRAETSTLRLAGAVEFDTPVPTERTYYAGQVADPGHLRPQPTGESGRRAWQGSITPLNELADEPRPTVFETTVMDRVPFTLDASRPLSGVVTHVSAIDWRGTPTEGTDVGSGVGITEIDIAVSAEGVDGVERALGTTTVTYLATPAQNTYAEPWSIELPAELDKADFSGSVTLTLGVRGYNAGHGYTVPDDTNFAMPIYSTSFDRRVQVAVDDGPYADQNVTVSDDRTGWTAVVPTPDVGRHVFKARVMQGWESQLTFNGWVSTPRTSAVVVREISVVE